MLRSKGSLPEQKSLQQAASVSNLSAPAEHVEATYCCTTAAIGALKAGCYDHTALAKLHSLLSLFSILFLPLPAAAISSLQVEILTAAVLCIKTSQHYLAHWHRSDFIPALSLPLE